MSANCCAAVLRMSGVLPVSSRVTSLPNLSRDVSKHISEWMVKFAYREVVIASNFSRQTPIMKTNQKHQTESCTSLSTCCNHWALKTEVNVDASVFWSLVNQWKVGASWDVAFGFSKRAGWQARVSLLLCTCSRGTTLWHLQKLAQTLKEWRDLIGRFEEGANKIILWRQERTLIWTWSGSLHRYQVHLQALMVFNRCVGILSCKTLLSCSRYDDVFNSYSSSIPTAAS